jgi:hypothetical protein
MYILLICSIAFSHPTQQSTLPPPVEAADWPKVKSTHLCFCSSLTVLLCISFLTALSVALSYVLMNNHQISFPISNELLITWTFISSPKSYLDDCCCIIMDAVILLHAVSPRYDLYLVYTIVFVLVCRSSLQSLSQHCTMYVTVLSTCIK